MKSGRLIVSLILVLWCTHNAFAQCSDAGVCTLASHQQAGSTFSLGALYQYGTTGGDENIIHQKIEASLGITLDERWHINAFMPMVAQSYKNISISGLGDVSAIVSYDLLTPTSEEIPKQLTVQLGGKFATASIDKENVSLRFQSGLGTNDLLFGAEYMTGRTEQWGAGIGMQIPFGLAKTAVDTLERGADLFGTISFTYTISKLQIGAKVLAIKRLANTIVHSHTVFIVTTDQSPDPIAIDSGDYELPDTNPFQLNLQPFAGYALSDNFNINASCAIPFIKRTDNSDGLKRTFSANVGLVYRLQ